MLVLRMKRRIIHLFLAEGERRAYNVYRGKELINCGICGNMTPKRNYLNNDCPTCNLGIAFEADDERSEKRLEKLERPIFFT